LGVRVSCLPYFPLEVSSTDSVALAACPMLATYNDAFLAKEVKRLPGERRNARQWMQMA